MKTKSERSRTQTFKSHVVSLVEAHTHTHTHDDTRTYKTVLARKSCIS